jgi:hypothetical protein
MFVDSDGHFASAFLLNLATIQRAMLAPVTDCILFVLGLSGNNSTALPTRWLDDATLEVLRSRLLLHISGQARTEAKF